MKRLTEAWFTFKGVDSRDMGIFIRSMPIRHMPGRNYSHKKLSGLDGSFRSGDGSYNDVRVQLECDIPNAVNIAAVVGWLSGDGELVFSDEPTLAYDAAVEKEFSRSSIIAKMAGQRFTITWLCAPFRRMIPAAEPIVIAAPGSFSNPGTVYSLPKITVSAHGDFSVSINQQTMFFSDVADGIVLDSELVDAFALDESVTVNERVYGEFFRLNPGVNMIDWAVEDGSAVESITIEPRWRCI